MPRRIEPTAANGTVNRGTGDHTGEPSMPVTRWAVMEALDAASQADPERWTTVSAIANDLGTDEEVVRTHLDRLATCELATVRTDGTARITITGQELLELDVEDVVVVDPEEVHRSG
jgi:hypothetical protein